MRRTIALATALCALIVLIAVPAQAATTSETRWGACSSGDTCLFDGRNGRARFWVAPDCGFWNLGTMRPRRDDRLTSIRNRSDSHVELLDLEEGEWVLVRTIRPWTRVNLRSWENDIVDAVRIEC